MLLMHTLVANKQTQLPKNNHEICYLFFQCPWNNYETQRLKVIASHWFIRVIYVIDSVI